MRISDWSSDVCSSDLTTPWNAPRIHNRRRVDGRGAKKRHRRPQTGPSRLYGGSRRHQRPALSQVTPVRDAALGDERIPHTSRPYAATRLIPGGPIAGSAMHAGEIGRAHV